MLRGRPIRYCGQPQQRAIVQKRRSKRISTGVGFRIGRIGVAALKVTTRGRKLSWSRNSLATEELQELLFTHAKGCTESVRLKLAVVE